jgi:hypothetical protein
MASTAAGSTSTACAAALVRGWSMIIVTREERAAARSRTTCDFFVETITASRPNENMDESTSRAPLPSGDESEPLTRRTPYDGSTATSAGLPLAAHTHHRRYATQASRSARDITTRRRATRDAQRATGNAQRRYATHCPTLRRDVTARRRATGAGEGQARRARARRTEPNDTEPNGPEPTGTEQVALAAPNGAVWHSSPLADVSCVVGNARPTDLAHMDSACANIAVNAGAADRLYRPERESNEATRSISRLGSMGLAACSWKPAARAFWRSSGLA